MPTTYKVLGQTTTTAASAGATVNLITDPTLEGISFSQTNIAAQQPVAITAGGSTWKLQAEITANNTFNDGVTRWGSSSGNAKYAGVNSIWCSITGTNQVGFITGPATSTASLTFASTGNYPSNLLSSLIPVSPNTVYYYGAYLNVGNVSSYTVTYLVKWYTSNGTWISHSAFNTTVTQNTWTKANSSSTSPSTAAYAVVSIYANFGDSGQSLGMDNAWLSTDSASSTTFPTPSTNNAATTAPFTTRLFNNWSGAVNASTTVTTYAGALTDLYTVPSATSTVASTLAIANLSTSATTYRVLVLKSGETAAKKNFIAFDIPIGATSADTLTLGMTLAAGDKVQVASDTADVSATLFGSEIS